MNRTSLPLALLVATFTLAGCAQRTAAPASSEDDVVAAAGPNADDAKDGGASKDGFEVDGKDAAAPGTKDAPKGDDWSDADEIPNDPTPPAKPTTTPPNNTATCTGDLDEVESNDTVSKAMKLPKTTVFCGKLDSANDVDFYTLTASHVQLRFNVENGADASLRITGPNSQQNMTGGGISQFGNGTPTTYTIQVRSSSGRTQVYGFQIQAQ